MSKSPFKMKGFSGFGNSPLKDHKKGHVTVDRERYTKAGFLGTPTYYEKGYTDKKTKRPKNTKAFKFTKVGKFLGKVLGGGGSRGGSSTKLGCGPGSCS
jgi:hypothetical protein